MEKEVLLDSSLLDVFCSFENPSLVKFLIEKIKISTGKRFFNKSFIKGNKILVKEFVDEFSNIKNLNSTIFLEKLGIEGEKEKKEILKEQKSESKAKVVFSSPTIPKTLQVTDFVTHFRNRYEELKEILQEKKELENLISIGKISKEKQKFSVIGMVYKKSITKTKKIILEIEDLTGKMKVLINPEKEDLLKECEDVALDSVLGFKGVGSGEIMFVNEIIFPEVFLPERKKSYVEESVAFIGDLHFGSKNFLEKDFLRFIDYLNGNSYNSEEALKIKYLFIVGDLITGIGNYPNQEKDLKISDLEEQFEGVSKILSKIRKDVTIIISPGNHDCVRIMEPQPLLDEKYAWPLYNLENVLLLGNPAVVNIGETKDFEGFNVLLYHGFSFPYYANTIPKLIEGKTMNQPEKIMSYLLKNRHLAPTHSSTQYFPLEKDGLLIRNTPDIFLSGHTHKSGIVHFNNVMVISVSSWEGLTPYQEKFGNKPDHCKVPLLNLKTRAIKILDFETGEDGIRLYREEEK
ncbi:MAG: metallophosphoesterase [Nanoarchaeota archaeon]|nr:metallophosphoesterase [Nanoarchaeota archaeon]